MRRSRRRGGGTTFKIGELHGRPTPRAQWLAGLLEQVDHAKVTADLWGERWVKLCANSMTTGLSGLTGLSLCDVYMREDTRGFAVKLAAEALVVGRAGSRRSSSAPHLKRGFRRRQAMPHRLRRSWTP